MVLASEVHNGGFQQGPRLTIARVARLGFLGSVLGLELC